MDVRVRRMRTFNTPFFPDVLVCSEVMGEGVDLHRFCRHVIHHDLAWNPSDIEQRTGRRGPGMIMPPIQPNSASTTDSRSKPAWAATSLRMSLSVPVRRAS
jgi:superfamily II DNA/RNA helicase